MKLINGPYNGREVEDYGMVKLRMAIFDGGQVKGAKLGEAIYLPNEKRDIAFWDENIWLGTLEEIIPA